MNPRHVLGADQLQQIAQRTIAHYDSSAEAFHTATRNDDVSAHHEAFLGAIERSPPFTLLDLGCGPGRDLAYFHSLGHKATGLDGSARLLEIARAHSGCEVLLQNLLALSLPPDRYDGIFANGSLFHVPAQEIPRVLGELHRSLVDRGVLFCSNPCGNDAEGFYGNRFGAFHRADTWCARVSDCGFMEVARYGWPKDAPADQPPWLATLFRKL
jgi:SAM-dependent methyltransferase